MNGELAPEYTLLVCARTIIVLSGIINALMFPLQI